jgi:dTDP-4-dehydrorhamnose reductase
MSSEHVYLLFGKNGWIGGKLIELLTQQGKKFYLAESRTYDRGAVLAEVEKYRPTHILNAAGVTGRPNVDWCEDNKLETIRSNVLGTLTIADICALKGIHHLLYATGCIFEYDDVHTIGGKMFTEEDSANFHGSFYSHTKAMCEDLLKNYPTTCTLRVRMPISDDLSPRNFITKIVKYDKVVNIPNSMTVLTDLLPISLIMAERNLTGIYNFCNPGAISHNEVLDLYKKYIDPSYTYTNFTVDEQAKILKAGRSNNTLDHTKLVHALPDVHIPEIHESMEKVFQRMRVNLEKEGVYPDKLPKRANK